MKPYDKPPANTSMSANLGLWKYRLEHARKCRQTLDNEIELIEAEVRRLEREMKGDTHG
jgi:hypothetical protein